MKDITDICEISGEHDIISCLKQRFMHDDIYVSNEFTFSIGSTRIL